MLTFAELEIGQKFVFVHVQRASNDAKIKTNETTFRYLTETEEIECDWLTAKVYLFGSTK